MSFVEWWDVSWTGLLFSASTLLSVIQRDSTIAATTRGQVYSAQILEVEMQLWVRYNVGGPFQIDDKEFLSAVGYPVGIPWGVVDQKKNQPC
ncbi:hypothetical protein Tco_1493070 [Tanacetum coccineum]